MAKYIKKFSLDDWQNKLKPQTNELNSELSKLDNKISFWQE
jgi:hypothetical protein